MDGTVVALFSKEQATFSSPEALCPTQCLSRTNRKSPAGLFLLVRDTGLEPVTFRMSCERSTS